MIRHRPFGNRDPYRLDPDQRIPAVPEAGVPFTLGALTSAGVCDVKLEWQVGGVSRRLPARRLGKVGADGVWMPSGAPPPPSGAGDGHLAAVATRTRRTGTVWEVVAPALDAGTRARYRFVATPERGGGSTRWHSVTAAQWQSAGGTLEVHGADTRVVADSLAWFVDRQRVHRLRFALRLAPGERVAGFGERFDRVDQRGHRLDSVVFEQYKDQGATGRTYFPMPFAHVIGGDGWGFHLRTSRRVWFDVGATEPDRLWIEVDTGGESSPTVALALYAGTPAEVLSAFLTETGRPQPLPDWVHRLWISGNEWNTQAAVMQRADRHRDDGIPYGVVVIEAWSDESTFCMFRDAQYAAHEDGSPHHLADITHPAHGAWPDPKGMVDELHARDVRVLLWQIPLQKMRPPPSGQAAHDAARMIADGYCVRKSDGRPYHNRGWWFPHALMPDFTNPQAREWWQAKRRYLVEEIGVDGFKTDGGEHAWGDDLRYHDGTGGELNNRYPVLYAETYHDLLTGCGKAPVTFCRAGYTGAQSYGCHWAGDENSTWQAYRNSIVAGITAGLSGVTYWGWDLAGFSGEIPEPELYIRATQASCFMPIMQYHSEFNFHRKPSRDRTPWNIAERHDRPDVLAEFQRWAVARELLVPYLHEQTLAGIRAGLPLMRAMVLAEPADDHVWRYPLQYLLGPDLLVAPVTEPGATSQQVYLPAGDWVDLCTGVMHRSGTVTRATPLSEVPVYVRAPAWSRLRPVHQHLAGSPDTMPATAAH